MRSNKTKWVLAVLVTIFILFGIIYVSSFETMAASKYETKYNYYSSGSTVTITKSGKYIDTISHSGGHVQPQMAFSGGVAYYTVNYGSTYYLYSKNLSTKNTQFYTSLPNDYNIWNPSEVYKGSIYIFAGNGSDNCACYRYYLKSGKLKKLCDGGYTKRVGKYIICDPSHTFGALGPLMQIYVYNTKTDKTKKIENGSCGYSIVGNVIYYSHNLHGRTSLASGNGRYDDFSIKTYNIKTGKKKTLVKKIKASHITKIGKKYFYYSVLGKPGSSEKYYRYNIKTKKKKAISFDQYRKTY